MEESLLTESISLGVLISLLFANVVGIFPGGIIVSGYIALYLNQPLSIITTFFISGVTFFTVDRLSSVLIIYGKRKTAITIVFSFLFKYLFEILLRPYLSGALFDRELNVIGYIIPGLIAISINTYGWIECLSSILICSILVKLILILFT